MASPWSMITHTSLIPRLKLERSHRPRASNRNTSASDTSSVSRGRVGEAKKQCSIGFQPVPRDHSAWPAKSATNVVVSQSRRSIGAEHRLEAYATLLADPD